MTNIINALVYLQGRTIKEVVAEDELRGGCLKAHIVFTDGLILTINEEGQEGYFSLNVSGTADGK